MTCKILDQGTEAEHFGSSLGGGVFVSRDEAGAVTLCRHPAGDVRTPADVAITLTEQQWTKAIAGAGRVPVHRAVKAEREAKAAARKSPRKAAKRARTSRAKPAAPEPTPTP